MSAPGLLPRVRQKTTAYLNQYIQSSAITEYIDTYITSPALGNKAGVLGAIALAKQHAQ